MKKTSLLIFFVFIANFNCIIINYCNAQKQMKNREFIIRVEEDDKDFPEPNAHYIFNNYFILKGKIVIDKKQT